MPNRPLWVEVSGERLLANYRQLREAAPSHAGLLPVVKANAYGHGVLLCAPLLAEAGAEWLGVTDAEEGVAVRAVCPQAHILLLSGLWPGDADAVLEHRLTPVVWESYHLDLLEEAAARRGMPRASVPVHLEIDTGMSRQGVRAVGSGSPGELSTLLDRFAARSCLHLEGVMTHFSTPEAIFSVPEASVPEARRGKNPQLANLSAAVDLILDKGLHPQWLHAGNSSTMVFGPDQEKLSRLAERARMSLALRPGLALYGYLDRFSCDGKPVSPAALRPQPGDGQSFQPVLSWKTRVTSLRFVHQGDTVGYDDTFIARRETRLALLPVGYADGVNRLLSNRGHVLIRGEEAPMAGRISMDQTIVDITGIPGVSIGDEVVLIGSQGRRSITAWDIADLIGTVPWEILCAIGSRVPRLVIP
jgi:alanine racemase